MLNLILKIKYKYLKMIKIFKIIIKNYNLK